MRLPSLEHVLGSARRAAGRFPLALASGVLAATAGILATIEGAKTEPLVRLGAAATLGLPLFVALTVALGQRGATPSGAAARPAVWLSRLLGIAALAAFWWAWPSWTQDVQWRRYLQFSVGLHLGVAFVPFFGWRDLEGAFWQYNRALFVRFLIAALFSAVLFGGLSVALLAIDQLLGIDVPEATYPRLWFVLAFVFNTWYFLGGVPDDLDSLGHRTDYPAGLRVFSQYILVPLVTLYVAILTAYLGRIIISGEWPSGGIGWLVSVVSVAGILSLLLIHPIREQAEQRWVRTYARWFYIALLPSIAMLLLSIGKRIRQYGVTEDRYFLVVLALWLTGIAIFYIARRAGSIRVIPTTLCMVAFLTSFGPWGAYAVSRGSQTARLTGLLERHGLLEAGRLTAARAEVPIADRREMSAASRYLFERHGRSALHSITSETFASADTTVPADRRRPGAGEARAFMSRLGLAYVDTRPGDELQINVVSESAREAERITGFDWRLRIQGSTDFTADAGGREIGIAYDRLAGTLTVRSGDSLLALPLAARIEAASEFMQTNERKPVPVEMLSFDRAGAGLRVRLVLRSVNGRRQAQGLELNWIEGELFVAFDP